MTELRSRRCCCKHVSWQPVSGTDLDGLVLRHGPVGELALQFAMTGMTCDPRPSASTPIRRHRASAIRPYGYHSRSEFRGCAAATVWRTQCLRHPPKAGPRNWMREKMPPRHGSPPARARHSGQTKRPAALSFRLGFCSPEQRRCAKAGSPKGSSSRCLKEHAAGRLRKSINPLDPCCGGKWTFQKGRKEERRIGQARRNDAPGASKVIDQRWSRNDGSLASKFLPMAGRMRAIQFKRVADAAPDLIRSIAADRLKCPRKR